MEQKEEKQVQNIRQLIPMRFRLTHQKAVQLRRGKRSFFTSVFDRIRGKFASSEIEEHAKFFCLKFVEKLSEECILVGNEYQLSVVNLACMQDYVEASSEWAIAEDDPISNLFVSSKVRSIFVVCQSRLHLYTYSLESNEQPVKEQTLSFPETVCGVYVVKRAIVLVLMVTRFEVLEISVAFGRTKLLRRKQCAYFPERHEGLEIISIPEDQGNILQVFFKDTRGTTLFTIYALKIECLSCEQVTVGTLHKFCQVPERYISTLQISHYRSDIYLVYVGLELYAVRNNYFLDSIITNTSKLRSFLKEFNSNFFFLYHKDRFELYRYELNERLTPERFQVSCLDTIPLTKPNGSYFLDIKQLGDHFVFIFQQPRPSDSNQLNFWLAVGDQVPVATKIDSLYPSSAAEVDAAERETLEERIEMALQMGLTLDAAYLELWQRSGKVSRRDYDLLIATQNYEMIAGELENKFKKSSLRFLELREVMERSLAMLQSRVRLPQPAPEHLRQLASCHFLLCKYRMFERVKSALGEELTTLTINIQDYYHLTRIELVKYLFELLSAYLTERNKSLILLQLRALLTQFSLIFRLKYHEILPAITKAFRKDILKLIKAIPELLPLEGRTGLESGPWGHIDLKQTDDYLILENYTNFQNRRSLEEFTQSKFFKVYQWHSHGALAESRTVLNEQLTLHNPEELFILFYEQLLGQANKTEQLDDLIALVESGYPLLPPHLRGRFRFYQALYSSFRSFHFAQRKEFMSIGQFLRLREDQLFEIYFQEERAKKGIFLLKEVEPIYERTVAGGRQLFLASMFRFFQGIRSSWADLKIVLNKFNNEKQDFHQKNYEVFEVMVNAIMEKVKVGQGEAGLVEVVSYLENIPFPLGHTRLLESLISIQEIRGEQATLRAIGIDMTLRQILENGEEVIFRMVAAEVDRYDVRKVVDAHELKLYAYKILAEVNYRKSNLYIDKHTKFPLKCFLMILMEDQKLIPACQQLLKDDFLARTFNVDTKLVENLVIYLYRKRLSINPVYEENKEYIDAIVNILEQANVKRRFLELSEIYAAMFSSRRYKMKYPFFKTYYPTVDEVAAVVAELDREELLHIDHEELFDLIIQFKALGEDVENIVETKRNRFANHSGEEKLAVMKHELYTVFFLNFMKHGLVKERALAIAADIMVMDTRYKIYNIIVPVFLIEIAQQELIAQLADPLTRLVSYYFNFQLELQTFVSSLFTEREGFTNAQLLQLFNAKREEKRHEPVFDPANPLFSAPLRSALQGLSRSEQAERFNPVFEQIWERVSRCREEFVKQSVYLMLYRLLLHNPYVLAQYLNRRKEGVNVCSLRALLTLIGMECLFDLQKLLELGEGVFSILMVELKSKILLEDLFEIFSRGEKYHDELKYTNQYCAQLIKLQAEDLIGNSILSFRNKMALLSAMDKSALEAEKEKHFSMMMTDRSAYLATQLAYPFDDRDKEYALPQEDLFLPIKHRRDKRLEFDEAKERSQLCEHLNYFIQPVFREKEGELQKTLAEFYLKFNKKLKKKHPVKTKSLHQDLPTLNPVFHSNAHLNPLAAFLPHVNAKDDEGAFEEPEEGEAVPDVMQKSQSLKIVADHEEEEQEDFNFGKFIDFLPEFKDPAENKGEHFRSILPQMVQAEVELCLQGKSHFNSRVLPPSTDREDLFEKIVGEVYNSAYYSLLARIQTIWNTKRSLLGSQSVDRKAQAITLRLGGCALLHSLLSRIQEIFTPVIFIEEYQQNELLQLVRENASQAVTHQEDMLKIAEIVGEAFASSSARESVLMLFLVRLCRSYSLTQDERGQNHLKDEILLLQQSIDPKTISDAAESYNHARNEDLRTTGKVLQFFRNYQSHLSSTSHIRISALSNEL